VDKTDSQVRAPWP